MEAPSAAPGHSASSLQSYHDLSRSYTSLSSPDSIAQVIPASVYSSQTREIANVYYCNFSVQTNGFELVLRDESHRLQRTMIMEREREICGRSDLHLIEGSTSFWIWSKQQPAIISKAMFVIFYLIPAASSLFDLQCSEIIHKIA